jgi:hypothetical protein
MVRKAIISSLLLLLPLALVHAETVTVSGSDTTYESTVQNKIGDKTVKMTLTGAALRKKYIFSVYTIGSYIEEGAAVRTAEELAAKDAPKMLHLVLERDVKGKDMAEATEAAIRANYPGSQFTDEIKVLVEQFSRIELKKGDNVRLTHVPGKGLSVAVDGKLELFITTPAFSRAIWDIYLGKNNLGDAIKKALVSRL